MKYLLTGDDYIKGAKRLEKSAGWKYTAQKFLLNRLTEISKLQKLVESERYTPEEGTKFKIQENGHERIINALTARDSVFQHALADEILVPNLSKYLIYDNGASLKNKGLSFTRRRFEEHLRWHYRRYGTDGYVLMIDFRKYFDNIQHDIALSLIEKKIPDTRLNKILKTILDMYKIDISYTNDLDIKDKVFNSLEYQKIPAKQLTGERYMQKSIGIGSQISQIVGIFYPTAIDNYCKTVKRIHCYDAYMDDRIIIYPNKEILKNLLCDIEEIAKGLGIFINHKKTQIVKISHGFTWLKTRYILTDTGKIIKKIPKDTIIRERRKLKVLSKKVEIGEIKEEILINQYRSWRGDKKTYNAYHTLQRMDLLYRRLENERKRNQNKNRNRNVKKSTE